MASLHVKLVAHLAQRLHVARLRALSYAGLAHDAPEGVAVGRRIRVCAWAGASGVGQVALTPGSGS